MKSIQTEIEKSIMAVISKSFVPRTFWLKSNKKFTSNNQKEDPIGEAILNAKTICADGKREVAAILSAVLKRKIELRIETSLPKNTLFILTSNDNSHCYPLNEVCLSSGKTSNINSWYKNSVNELVSGNTPSLNYRHPTCVEFTEWFSKLTVQGKIKFVELVS